MTKFFNIRCFVIPLLLLQSCVSGKVAYQHGEYYEAVVEAVQRLRHSPENKKSAEVLNLSYQAAIDNIKTDIQNQLASNANLKWKSVVLNYQKINTLYEDIRSCPGALKIIPKPIDAYADIKTAKDSAAAECYDAGIQEMLKGTRDDAKQAFFLFTDANNFSPGYRESIEMIQQAKTNATIKVVVKSTSGNSYNWSFDPILFHSSNNQFVAFYTEQQVMDQNIQKIDQTLSIVVNGYIENRPFISRNSQEYQNNIEVGTKADATGKQVPIFQLITASATVFDKQVLGSGSLQLLVGDATSGAQLANEMIQSEQSWSCRWAVCNGDSRALPPTIRNLCGRSELFPAYNQLIAQTKRDLDNRLGQAIAVFYSNY